MSKEERDIAQQLQSDWQTHSVSEPRDIELERERQRFGRYLSYDKQARPITQNEFAVLKSGTEYHRVAADVVGPLWVSTVWLGFDHRFIGHGPPIIFETMIFDDKKFHDPNRKLGAPPTIETNLHPEIVEITEQQWRYCTEEQARDGHNEIVERIRVLLLDVENADAVMRDAVEDVDHE